MTTSKNWQDVLLRRERLRGWLEGWNDHLNSNDDLIEHAVDLTYLEALQPCAKCGGVGKTEVAVGTTGSCCSLDLCDETFFATCKVCGGTGIAPENPNGNT